MQRERSGQYWDLDEAAWLPVDEDPRRVAADEVVDEAPAAPAPDSSEPS